MTSKEKVVMSTPRAGNEGSRFGETPKGLVKMDSDRKVFYLRDETGFPVACVAVIANEPDVYDPAGLRLRVGISSWNPADVYNKDTARNKALGRAMSKQALLVDRATGVKTTLVQFIAEFDPYKNPGFWISEATVKAAKLWLKKRKDRKREEEIRKTVVGRLLNIGESHTSYGFLVNPQEVL